MISFKLTKEVAVYRTDAYSLTSSTEKGAMQYRLDTNNKLRFSKKNIVLYVTETIQDTASYAY